MPSVGSKRATALFCAFIISQIFRGNKGNARPGRCSQAVCFHGIRPCIRFRGGATGSEVFFQIHSNPLYQEEGQASACPSSWWRRRDSPAFFAGKADALKHRRCRAKNQGIRQCTHWLMHSPPGCADMIRIPYAKKKTHPVRWVFFLVETEGFEPLTLRMRTVRSPS